MFIELPTMVPKWRSFNLTSRIKLRLPKHGLGTIMDFTMACQCVTTYIYLLSQYSYSTKAGPYTLNTVTNNQPLGAYYPETPSNSFEEAASEPKESDSTIAPGILTQEESHTTGMGENHFAATELIDRYQVVEVFKQIVSLLPSVFDKPDAPALSPIPLTKRVLTAVKFHRMLPDKFPCPLHGSSGRRGEKVFFHPGPTAIQWFGYGRQHALVIGVRTQDHPTLGFRLEGTFKDLYNQKREMFHVQKNNLYYAGTYRCLRIEQMITIPEIIESLDLSLIDKPFKADLIKAAMQAQRHRTPNDPSLRLDRMTELCLDGTIKFEWVAFQCVGFDEDVFRALGGRYVGPSVPIVEYVQKLLRESTNVLNADQSEPQLSEQDTDASIEVDEVYA
ncbi:hypothetical protein F5050DRAFT_1727991 [Lentinula boryana]|uniref:Uncharacterized protein n=1 Tax=Lentinula boryana TaxID=40481 RepID=A0ABQ8QQZ7_9AGAR|nr:hypothetical protein F5050DRAFT_1727991 [Lentinula boryana]